MLLPLITFAQPNISLNLPDSNPDLKLFEKATTRRYTHPDSSMIWLDRCFKRFLNNQDTLNAIYVLREQARIYGNQASYKESYDKLWKALLLADEAGLEKAKAFLYINIGRYYSFYKRRKNAVEYFQLSLDIKRRLVKEGKLNPSVLADNYYAFSSTYRELGEPELSRQYLDSCYTYHANPYSRIQSAYLEFEEAFLLKEQQKYQESLSIYRKLIPWMQENDPGYQVLIYTYMGDVYGDITNFEQSEECYKSALAISERYNSHLDFIPLVHKRLSELYYNTGKVSLAFQSLKKEKELDEKFFDSRSQNNRPLLEIQDAFRLEKEAQRKLIQEQQLEQLQHEEKIFFLQRTMLIVILIFITLFTIVYFNYVRNKYKTEKQLIQKKQELEIQKANEIIELKNRELSTSTLKLIQKEEFISNLKEKISQNGGEMSMQELKRTLNSISASNQQNWKEFEARFIEVNKEFYSCLKRKYPKLTQGDLKLCALIKLNFSSKDMAKLMGISVESVHTTRYRLRKKLGLKRGVNLAEFISNI